jgi:amidophosphoribosyltransferase
MARDAGAKKVFMASAAPGVRYPNVYGIDMPSASELIAHGRTDEEVGALIGADWLIYQDLEDLIASASEGNVSIKQFECSVFNGEYITGDVDQAYLSRIDSQRNDAAKLGEDSTADIKQSQVIGIHNNGMASG